MSAWERWCARTGHDPHYHGWLLILYASMLIAIISGLWIVK